MVINVPTSIAIAADHNGVPLKAHLTEFLISQGCRVVDLGTNSDEVVDYPYFCYRLAKRVLSGEVDRGVMIGGSGQGETIALNKIRGVRAGLCNSLFDAEISSGNNNANILVLAGKVLSSDFAEEILTLWLNTPFRGGVHQKRLDLISMLEAGKELN
jgi:ribose 5-phosphate isomerase B